MFGRAVIIAQCTWQCHYKDFSQHLIRWCFHAPASIIRLTLASCMLFKCLLDNFHRRKSVCFNANASLPPSPTTAGSHADHRVGLQPEPTQPSLRPFTGASVLFLACRAAWMHESKSVKCDCDILLKAGHVSEGLSHLVSIGVTKNPFEPLTEMWHTSVLLPGNTSWMKARKDRGREQQIQLQIP